MATIAEKLFPISIVDICNIINTDHVLYHLDPSERITGITVADNFGITEGCLFIPYKETDEQCAEAIRKGAAAILSDHEIGECPCLVAQDSELALYRICEWLREHIPQPALIVAGSEGKTTTKRMVASVLETEKRVFCVKDNYNTFQALCGSLQKIDTDSEYIVQEVDERRDNCPRNCSMILRPEIALVTNIAEAHLSYFGTIDALTDSFRGITSGMDENGIVIINGDNPNSINACFDAQIIRVGIYNRDCECTAADIRERRRGVEFDLSYGGETEHIRLSVHGEHNVYNAMMAFVVGKLKGISTADIRKGLSSYHNSGIRQNICQLGNTLIYADCYNASATSVRYALKCFDELPAGGRKKVAVLGDIAEIEGFEEDTYRRIAGYLDESGIDELVTCGKESERIHSYLKRDMGKKHTRDLSELNQYLKARKKQGGGNYLFKASRVMRLEKSIREVFPYHYKWIKLRDRFIR